MLSENTSATRPPRRSRRRPLLRLGLPVLLMLLALRTILFVTPGYAQTASPLTIQPETGRVGIGTSNPRGTLDISAGELWLTGGTYSIIRLSTSGLETYGAGIIYDRPSGRMDIYNGTGSETRVVIQPSGNVGIGTTNPGARLDVVGGYVMVRGTTTDHRAYLQGTTGSIGGYSGGLVYMGNLDGGALCLGNSDSWCTIFADGGNVGIGTVTPSSILHVAGTLTATQKNFAIAHPLDPEKKLLVHSSLEGPEVGVYYRGEAQLANGEASVTLPPYFEALTRKEQRTVQLTTLDGWSPLYVVGGVQGGRFIVRTAAGGNPAQRFYWEVKAVRADVAPLALEAEKPK